MKTKIEAQMEYLQNAGNSYGLTIHIFKSEDKRKAPLFFAQKGNATISPNLDYSNLNHFLLGYGEALKLFNQKDVFNVKETNISTAEKFVLNFIDGLKTETLISGNVYWNNKDGKWLFTQGFKNGLLLVDDNIRTILENEFGLSSAEATELLTKVLYDYTDNGKLKVV